MPVRIIDLFAGLGGIRLGFTQAFNGMGVDVDCVFSSEIKPYALDVYRANFGAEDIAGDITQIPTTEIPDFDYLLAGFPCQPFSTAGLGRGFEDTRGTLFFEIERILRDKINAGHPARGFLLENVEGLIGHDSGNTLRTIIEHLVRLGYHVNYKLLDSKNFGLAQSRKRVYIVGSLNREINLDGFDEVHSNFSDIQEHGLDTIQDNFSRRLFQLYRPEQLYGKSIKDKRGGDDNIHSWDLQLKGAVSDDEVKLLNALLKERRKKHWAEEIGITWMDGMPLTEAQIATFFNHQNLHELLDDLKEKGYLAYEHPKKKTDDGRVPDETLPKGYNIVAGKLSFEFSKILDPEDLAPTLVAMDVSKIGVIDGFGIRRLTIREGERLCGYPETYDMTMVSEADAFDLLGNTVCIPVIKAVAERLCDEYIGG